MNINILTIHAMHNPGSVFQAYALQEYLSAEHNVKIIDYRPFYFYSEGSRLKFFLKKILWRSAFCSRNQKFSSFIEKYFHLTPIFRTYDDLKNAKLEADVFMTGSDQLWNTDFPCGNDDAFYLSFVENGRKIAYSTSVGKKEIDEFNMSLLKKCLSSFDAIAVREKSTAEQLKNVLNRDIVWACDPVFLLQPSLYTKFLSEDNPVGKKYAMVYLLDSSEKLDQLIRYYKSKGLYIVLAGGFTKRCECDLHIKDVGPEDFLNLIYHASVVISSSFHATAFCHIFHKDFVTILPSTNGERICSLLKESGLENRSVHDDGRINIQDIECPVDWSFIDDRLKNYISQSKEFLKTVLMD